MKKCLDCPKIIDKRANRCNSCATKEKYRLGILNNKGKNNPHYTDGEYLKERTCKDCGKELKGHHLPIRCKKCANKGKLNPCYVHGKNHEPYAIEFNDELRLKIRKRDNYKCQICDMTEEEHIIVLGKVLTVHHIDYNKENSDERNLITLCSQCNRRVNFNRSFWFQHLSEKVEA